MHAHMRAELVAIMAPGECMAFVVGISLRVFCGAIVEQVICTTRACRYYALRTLHAAISLKMANGRLACRRWPFTCHYCVDLTYIAFEYCDILLYIYIPSLSAWF